MEITEVRIKLVDRPRERLRAFCSITLDGDFVIRDLKIIDGPNGVFVAMPSRKLADRCPRCGCKNHVRARFCNECGLKLNENRAPKDPQGRAKLHADIAHPINAGCRERIQNAVIEAFQAELKRAESPDYKPPVFDDFEDDGAYFDDGAKHPVAAGAARPAPRVETKASVEREEEGSAEDYNSLIADLKKEAASRRDQHEERRNSQTQGSLRSYDQGQSSTDSAACNASSRPPAERNSAGGHTSSHWRGEQSPNSNRSEGFTPHTQSHGSGQDDFSAGLL